MRMRYLLLTEVTFLGDFQNLKDQYLCKNKHFINITISLGLNQRLSHNNY